MRKALINDPAYMAIVLRDIHNLQDKVPDGFLTTKQWQKRWKGFSKPLRILNLGIKTGMVVRKNFRVLNRANKVLPVPHYKFIGKEPNKPRKK